VLWKKLFCLNRRKIEKKVHWRKSRTQGEMATAVFHRTSRKKKAFCRRGPACTLHRDLLGILERRI